MSLFKCYHLYYLNTAMSTHRYKTLAQTSHNLILTSQELRTIEFWLTDNLWINPYKLLLITVSRFGKSWFAYIALAVHLHGRPSKRL